MNPILNRRELLRLLGLTTAGSFFTGKEIFARLNQEPELRREAFGKDFLWGVATAAYQVEGGFDADGRGLSIWDTFCRGKGRIKDGNTGDIACDFYNQYTSDLDILKSLNMDVFRFSTSWSRLLPNGTGRVNIKGADFYHRVIDKCLENDIQPWLTLYHWDLPQALQDKGGWMNRDVINWFSEYTQLVTKLYGDKVKNWLVLNEPAAFSALGYFLGMHAPGIRGIKHFTPSVHHVAMCQSEGGRVIRANVPAANIGTTFSCSYIMPWKNEERDHLAVQRWDALLNRLYIEPSLGLGYPLKSLPVLRRIEDHIKDGDMEKLPFDFDFIGVQNYTREVVKKIWYIPYMRGLEIKPQKRGAAEITAMGWEVYPEALYWILRQFAAYKGVKKIYITENGSAFNDVITETGIHDTARISYYKKYLAQLLRAKNEGINLGGYLTWTLLDNFEWQEGYRARFGLVHVDFTTQQRRIKDSGLWFREFLTADRDRRLDRRLK